MITMMKLKKSDKLSIVHEDIFELDVDAIVIPTNTDLLLGAGIAGELRRKAGIGIQEECLEIGSVALGQSVVTTAGRLKVPYIIHAAVMKIGGVTVETGLVKAIESAGIRIKEKKMKRVAFPPMGIGIGRFPLRSCAEVMIRTILTSVVGRRCLKKVYIVLPDEDMCTLFEEMYDFLTEAEDNVIVENGRID